MEAFYNSIRAGVGVHLPRAQWPYARIFVPHSAAATTLRHALKPEGMGVLPEVIAMESAEPFALALGVVLPPPANPWPVRAQAVGLLQTAYPALQPSALVPRCEELLQTLNLLATYEVAPGALAASIPAALRPLWDDQAQVLQALWGTLYPKAASVLPAARRSALWREIEASLKNVPLQGPLLWWGEEPHEPPLKRVYQQLLAMGMHVLRADCPAAQVYQFKAAHPLEEMQQAVLWVAEHLAAGVGPIGLVASGAFARRFTTEMEARFGIVPQTTGGLRWHETPRGAALLQAARGWSGSSKTLSMGYWLEGLLATLPEDAAGLREAVLPLLDMPERWDGATAYAWLKLALDALAPRTEYDDMLQENRQDCRIAIVPPHRAVGQPFAALWVAEAVEGVWPLTPKPGALAMAQRRALGLPDAEQQAQAAHSIWQAVQQQGGTVVFSGSAHDEAGVLLTPSRWWQANVPVLTLSVRPEQLIVPQHSNPLGCWHGPEIPRSLSASMLQSLLACPYQAYAERVLKLAECEPLLPEPDPRAVGLAVHAWLEAGLRHTPYVTPENAEALVLFLRAQSTEILNAAPPLVRVVWAPRLHMLAPKVVAWWQARAGQWRTEVTLRSTPATAQGAEVAVHAKIDAMVEHGAYGTEILDYKTGTPPSKTKLKRGQAPQLPIEAWLATQAGYDVETLSYLHIKGYSEAPLIETRMPAAAYTGPVAATLAAVLAEYYQPSATWPAVPDTAGLGVLATGACKTCALKGVCRREEGAF